MGTDSTQVLRRLVAVLAGVSAVLVAGIVLLLLERSRARTEAGVESVMEDERVLEEAVDRLVAGGEGAWDSFPDPDVGRVLQRNLEDRAFRDATVSSNRYGMREGPYPERKPEGTTRVVLLGDSFVFGYNAAAGDRLGVFLQRFLAERGTGGPVEVLHLAASSWNVRAETAYLRRQLHTLRPDLVVQVIVANDLDDTSGARGFGSMAATSPQVPWRVEGTVSNLSPPRLWTRRVQTYLLYGLDHQSRSRLDDAARRIGELARAVEATGGRYLLLAGWESFNPVVAEHIAPALRPEQVAWLSQTFTQDARWRIDEQDRHWNRAGHERVALLLYGLAVERGLLPDLSLGPWPEARAVVEEVHLRGALEAARAAEYRQALVANATEQIRSAIDFGALERETVKQVYAGVEAGGLAAPYASLVLARGGGGELVLQARRLDAELLTGGTARVSVEGVEVGSVSLSGAPLEVDARWPLPAEAAERPFLTVTIESDDYLYTNAARGTCSSLQLVRIAVE